MSWALYVALTAVLAGTIAFPTIALRGPGPSRDARRRRIRTDVAVYLVSSTVWFALLYFAGSSSAIEGLHFDVASAAIGTAAPNCVTTPGFVCSPLTFVEALQFSAGNRLTLGAAGITPLDDVTRMFALLQLLPVFTSLYVLARN
jgi:hypothetical protein